MYAIRSYYGSRVIGLLGAMLFAALFEAGGALLAGDEVISTIQQGIISPAQFSDGAVIVRIMLAALLAAALWLHFATLTGTPVSTTHAIVGGVLRITSYNVCYTKLLRRWVTGSDKTLPTISG